MVQGKNLKSLIKNHKKIFAIYGLGNVGGPLAAAWLRKDAKVIGVSLDGYAQLDTITSHINEMPMTFDNLIGELTVVAFNYEASTEESLLGTPTYMMFNPQGQLVGHNPGPVKLEALENFIQRDN